MLIKCGKKKSFCTPILAVLPVVAAIVVISLLIMPDVLKELVASRDGSGRRDSAVAKNGLRSALENAGKFQGKKTSLVASESNEHEELRIYLEPEDFEIIKKKRKKYIKERRIFAEDNRKEYVPIEIESEGKRVKAKMRLKGDSRDHIVHAKKWSFRVVVKGEGTVKGMKQFSLQRPKTRFYLNEYFFHEVLRHLGLVALRYDFVRLYVNDNDYGSYAVEEHFEKHVIENSGQREGPIVRMNEFLRWSYSRRYQVKDIDIYHMVDNYNYETMYVAPFNKSKVFGDEKLSKMFVTANNLLENLRIGKLSTHEAFDVRKLADYFAVLALMQEKHASHPDNIRFYYNPVTSLLEPIGYDEQGLFSYEDKRYACKPAGLSKQLKLDPDVETEHHRYDWYTTLFEDPVYFEEYIQALERISEKTFLDDFFALTEDAFDQKIGVIRIDEKDYGFEDKKNILYQNQKYIRHILNPTKGIYAFLKQHSQEDNILRLQVADIAQFPMEVHSLAIGGTDVVPSGGRILQANTAYFAPEYVDMDFPLGNLVFKTGMLDDALIRYSVYGSTNILSVNVFPWSYLDDVFLQNDVVRQEPNFRDKDRFPFLKIDDKSKEVVIMPGSWTIRNFLRIPAGYTVKAGRGVRLDMVNSSVILSYSPVVFEGEHDDPVIFSSSDRKGCGLVVIKAAGPSVMKHVIFENLRNANFTYWTLTGAVNFYESPVTVESCVFKDNKCEDALNLIRSEGNRIVRTQFLRSHSDAVDLDFSDCEITLSTFQGTKGDSIDVSGSNVTVSKCLIDASGDKGISGGEKSELRVSETTISHCKIGIASKDYSCVDVADVSISRCNIGFALYQKKPEYGPAKMRAENVELNSNFMNCLVELESKLTIDGERVIGQE